jgi:hypothetical protein
VVLDGDGQAVLLGQGAHGPQPGGDAVEVAGPVVGEGAAVALEDRAGEHPQGDGAEGRGGGDGGLQAGDVDHVGVDHRGDGALLQALPQGGQPLGGEIGEEGEGQLDAVQAGAGGEGDDPLELERPADDAGRVAADQAAPVAEAEG